MVVGWLGLFVCLGPILNSAPNLKVELQAVVRRIIMAPYSDPSIRQEDMKIEKASNNKYNDSNDSNNGNDSSETNENEALYYVVGVEYEQNSEIKTAYLDMGNPVSKKMFKSSRCVIVAAGALLTPKLLMNSGIGPEAELKKTIEKTKNDDKSQQQFLENEWVGRNLQDHPAVGVIARVTQSVASVFPSGYSLVSHWEQYISAVERARAGEDVKGSEFGVLASVGLSAGAFLVSPFSKDGVPDIQLTFFPTISEPTLNQREIEKIKAAKKLEIERKRNHTKNLPGHEWEAEPDEWSVMNNLILVTVALINPDARYEVVLNEDDPINLNPEIRIPNGETEYLSEADVSKLVWGTKSALGILGSVPISSQIEAVVSPSTSVRSDSQYRAWVRENNYPNSHWVGTARMGSSPKTSVVNEELKVWNVNGLRVADASVIPNIPNGNVHSSVLVVSSILSDLLADEIKKSIET